MDQGIMTTTVAVLVLFGGVFTLLGVGSVTGRLRRNSLAGIRISATMVSDEAWAAGHRAAAPIFFTVGGLALLLIVPVVFGWLPGDPETILLGYSLFLLVMVWPMVRVATKAARHVADRP